MKTAYFSKTPKGKVYICPLCGREVTSKSANLGDKFNIVQCTYTAQELDEWGCDWYLGHWPTNKKFRKTYVELEKEYFFKIKEETPLLKLAKRLNNERVN